MNYYVNLKNGTTKEYRILKMQIDNEKSLVGVAVNIDDQYFEPLEKFEVKNNEFFELDYLKSLYGNGEVKNVGYYLNTPVGTFYIESDETDSDIAFVLCDSNKEFIANCYERSICNDLTTIKHISDIVDLGVGNNMIFGKSKQDCIEEYKEYASMDYEDYEAPDDLPINVVGSNYFIIDYTEL